VQIVDASVIAHALVTPEEVGNLSRQLLEQSSQIVSPDCLYSEVLAALRKMWLRKTISDQVFLEAVNDLKLMRIYTVDSVELLGRAYELRHNVGAYDAMYVALAEILQCPLITTDARLSNASGVRCEIELLAA
jgi:predicted nucleic acid-binding protein